MLTEELGRHGDSGKAVPAAHSPEKPQTKGWKEAQEVLAPKGPPGLENSLLRGEPPFSWLRNSITGAEEKQSFVAPWELVREYRVTMPKGWYRVRYQPFGIWEGRG